MLGVRRPTPHHPKNIRRGGRYLTHCAAHPIPTSILYLTPWYFFHILSFSKVTSVSPRSKVPVSFYGFLSFKQKMETRMVDVPLRVFALHHVYSPKRTPLPLTFPHLRAPSRFSETPPVTFYFAQSPTPIIFSDTFQPSLLLKCHDSTCAYYGTSCSFRFI
jgi:hypothetical protein